MNIKCHCQGVAAEQAHRCCNGATASDKLSTVALGRQAGGRGKFAQQSQQGNGAGSERFSCILTLTVNVYDKRLIPLFPTLTALINCVIVWDGRLSLDEASSANCDWAQYRVEPITLVPEEGLIALAFLLPGMIDKWKHCLREIAMDSAWNTNGSRYEVYVLLGEVQGFGLPLGYLLIQSNAATHGAKENLLRQLLRHVRKKKIKPSFTLSDKDFAEINAFRHVFPEAKHQLCFWHVIRAVKKRLSILRRAPAYYDAKAAQAEFHWVSQDFLPVGQSGDKLQPLPRTIPVIKLRLNGVLQATQPPLMPRLFIRIPPASKQTPQVDEEVPTEDETLGDWKNDETGELLKKVSRFADDETDEEDAPDWFFEEGETRSGDPDYVFCPAPHRKQLLHLFTRHFCQHPIFHEPDKKPHSTTTYAIRQKQIREAAVYEMYQFCHQRQLNDVWAYFWNNWYSGKRWPLWARSTSPHLSRLRTTMTVENFWKQLKHEFLHHLLRPRLDQLIWILVAQVTPTYMYRAEILDTGYRAGRSRPLTAFQTYFKWSWIWLQSVKCSGKKYMTSIETWTCNCGAQKYNTHHLCKHLVQAVGPLPMTFWGQVIRRRAVPLYRHPDLRALNAAQASTTAAVRYDLPTHNGNISDRDDQGASTAIATHPSALGIIDTNGPHTPSRRKAPWTPLGDDSSGDEEMSRKVRVLERTTRDLIEAGEIILDQLPHRNNIWINSMHQQNIGAVAGHLVHDVRWVEATGHVRENTWPQTGDLEALRRSRNTMGYQVWRRDWQVQSSP
ncbi:hypothetical protein EW146_g7526 [Bondarzewia mesenterica]|uniref:SWIM-type domain-containing protein n=1 Tax=Bondarzewia mesenterica TaxID=1095465 RepID=A0A4S4LL28_9AGAM|nr:hypothetical protein EW146_g7526 [Bondarzewia mesenterica]